MARIKGLTKSAAEAELMTLDEETVNAIPMEYLKALGKQAQWSDYKVANINKVLKYNIRSQKIPDRSTRTKPAATSSLKAPPKPRRMRLVPWCRLPPKPPLVPFSRLLPRMRNFRRSSPSIRLLPKSRLANSLMRNLRRKKIRRKKQLVRKRKLLWKPLLRAKNKQTIACRKRFCFPLDTNCDLVHTNLATSRAP
eukprot:scaffold1614_cov130-Amphora_coffeaeformis.AAC.2